MGTTTLHLLCHIYADRSAPIWKQAAQAEWLQRAVASLGAVPLGSKTGAFARAKAAFDLPSLVQLSIFRHTSMYEAKRSFQSFIPSEVRQHIGYAWDPLVPGTAISIYNEEFFGDVSAAAAAAAGLGDNQRPELDAGLMQELQVSGPRSF